MIDFSKLATVGDEYYLTKDSGGLTLVEIVSKTNSHIYVNFIIDNKVRCLSNECFNHRCVSQSSTYRDEYDVMADNNKYLTNAKVLRRYYNNKKY